jgi:hypothetical protein
MKLTIHVRLLRVTFPFAYLGHTDVNSVELGGRQDIEDTWLANHAGDSCWELAPNSSAMGPITNIIV